jgi:hypothetical protein
MTLAGLYELFDGLVVRIDQLNLDEDNPDHKRIINALYPIRSNVVHNRREVELSLLGGEVADETIMSYRQIAGFLRGHVKEAEDAVALLPSVKV